MMREPRSFKYVKEAVEIPPPRSLFMLFIQEPEAKQISTSAE